MLNQRLRAKRMRNQRFRIYIQMSTVIHKFLLRLFSDFRVFQIFNYAFKKKAANCQLSTLQQTIFFATDEMTFKLSQRNLYVENTSI